MSRQTRQREVVLEAVRSTMEHPTAEWVHRQARRRLPHISLGTVYRNLRRLAEEGLIGEVHAEGHAARFDANTGRHYHIVCLGCGRVGDLPLSVDAQIERRAAEAVNYEILGHRVEVQGLCPACRDQGNRNRSHSGEAPAPGSEALRPAPARQETRRDR